MRKSDPFINIFVDQYFSRITLHFIQLSSDSSFLTFKPIEGQKWKENCDYVTRGIDLRGGVGPKGKWKIGKDLCLKFSLEFRKGDGTVQ